jgi:hypothetical protein
MQMNFALGGERAESEGSGEEAAQGNGKHSSDVFIVHAELTHPCCERSHIRQPSSTESEIPHHPDSQSPRRATFTFLDDRSASGRAFSAFLYSTHSALGLRANAEADRADDDTDARRRGPFLNNPASLRGRLLNDVVIGKGGRNNESR